LLESSFGKVGKRISVLLLVMLTLFAKNVNSQVSAYSFTQSAGTYTEITGGTLLATATANTIAGSMDSWTQSITGFPFTFTFNGVGYTGCTINSNGYITFGATTALSSATGPITATTAYDGAVAPWGGDINALFSLGGRTGTIRWEVVGTAPNREIVIQWKDFRPAYSTSVTNAPFVNFQVRLSETTNTVKCVYGASGMAIGTTNVNTTRQIGLRGSTSADFNIRTNSTTVSFNSSTAGAANTAVQSYSSILATPGSPTNGLTYIWTPPSCLAPSAVSASAITLSSATLSWTAPASAPASGYQYYYSTSSTAPTAVTAPTGSTAAGVTSVGLTGLTANTLYYFWVRSNCGGSQSAWTLAYAFTTGYCTPSGLTTSTTYYLSNVVTTGGITNISNSSVASAGGYGNNSATLSCSNYVGAATTIALTTSSGTNYYYCWIDWNNDLDFADANETIFATTTYTTGYTGTINIPAGTPNGNYRMRVANSFSGAITACGPATYGEYEDYTFSVVSVPTCVPPTALISGTITPTSATISWTAPATAPGSGYNYYVSTSNTAPTGATVPTGSTAAGVTTASLTGLVANTTYYFWVQSNCGGGNGTSAWAGSSNFYTGYCQPTGSTTYYLSNASTTGGLTNFTNATGASAGGYGNYSSTTSCSQVAGSSITFNLTETGGTSYFYGWIDWNNDLDFADAGEAIFATTTYAATYSGAYTVPLTAVPGSYRLRFANSDLGTINGPCGPWTYGEYEDYTFIVATPPSCFPPTALTNNNTTTTGTTISWTSPATAPGSGYNYYVSTTNNAPTGATVPTGSTAAGVTSATITGLTANTTYYFWVQSNCGAGDLSVWAGSSSFYTGYCVPTGLTTSTLYYVSNVVTTGGLTNISNATTAAAGGYINYASTISCSNYPGTPTSITVTSSSGTNYFYCWIDWNNDLDFADANETIFATTTYTTSNTGTINIPAGTAPGTYRMRVANSEIGAITACGPAAYGEYEEYAFVVTPLPLCTGTPAPGASLASQTAFCSGTGTVNLSLSSTIMSSGISYQWQSSTDGVSYSDVSGATSATYTTPTLSSTTYYQCVVTCSAGGSATSTPVAIIFGSPSAPTATNSVSCGPGIPTGTVASTSGLTNPNLTWYTAATGGNVVLTSYTGALTSYYSNDFSSNTGIGALTGNASLTGGVVQLTPNAGSQLGALTIPASGVSADKYNVSFNLITSNVAQSGADGLSYSFGDDVSGTSTTVAAETGSGTKLMVSFDDYGTAGTGIAGIRVLYGSTISDPGQTVGTNGVLAYNATTTWTNGNVPVVIDINNLGQLTLTVNGTAIFSNLQLPAAFLNANKATWKHGFKARTGGVSMIHSIDNVNIQQSSYVAATAYPNNVLATTTYYVTEANSVGCQSTATPITFTVNAAPAMTISAATATVCAGSASSLVTLTSAATNYDTYTWTPSASVSGSSAAGWNFTPSANTTYTLTGTNATTQCSNIANITVTVNTLPTALTVTPSAATMCVGNIQNLVATGGTMNATMFSEDFNGGVSSWTITNAGTSPVVSNWTAQTAPYTDATGSATFSNFSTANGGKFAYSNPDAGGSGSTTNTVLMSPSFSTMNATNATLTFEHVYRLWSSGDATVALEISSDNGATWTVLKDYKTLGSQGTTTSNAQVTTNESIVLGAAYLNKPNVKIRFNYVSTWGYFWIIDNIKVMGNQTVNVTWAGANAFSNATATTAYVTGTNTTSIYAKPTTTTTYTATATSAAGCTSSGTATLTLPTAGTALSQDNENATCTVTENGWVHFYHSSGRLIGSINSQGQNLGAVTVTSYVDPTNALVPACTNPNPMYSTSVMQRHWVITPTNQPTSAVLVRFPYSDAEFSGLTSVASTNANPNDDLLTPADLGMTKYSNGTAANVNADPTDNCGVGTATFHTQLGTGLATSYSGVTANYVDFSIPGFSEFWLHGSSTASPLPVELVNFQANCAGEGKVEVTWATASEHNSANFTVEKSRDGINWTVLSSVAGAGNSTQMINYSVMDNNAASGVNYYRLTQTDFDGASETFNIASANCGDNSPLTTVKVYPNPSTGDFYIDFTSEEITGASVITITDARGMAVYKQDVTITKGSNVFHIENMEVAPGMYYIQVSNGTATSNIVKHSLR
jgi:hypothetical protein